MLTCVLGTKNLAQFGGVTLLWQAVALKALAIPLNPQVNTASWSVP